MEKRGIGHIEVIVSFVLFVAAVGFALYFFFPTIQEDPSNSLSIESLIYFVQTPVKIYSVFVDNTGLQVSHNPGSSLGLDINESENFAVFDGSDILNSERVGGIIYVNKSWKEKEIIYVIFSSDIEEKPVQLNKPAVNPSFYKLGAVQNLDILSETKLFEINKSYYEEYNLLRKNLNLGKKQNFRFDVEFDGQIVKGERKIPVGAEVYSLVRDIRVLEKNGLIVDGKMRAETW